MDELLSCAHAPNAAAEQEEYTNDLLWVLDHSENEEIVVLGLTCYFDDSGSDEGSPVVTLGGPAMSRIQFKTFSERWRIMLESHGIDAPLHMADFTGSGKYKTKYPEFKRHLFLDVAALINQHKLYSVSIVIPHEEFKNQLSRDIRHTLIGPYAFAFFAAVLMHRGVSEMLSRGPLKASYVVDSGFGHSGQLTSAHSVISDNEKKRGGFRHTGALAFDSDDKIPALQAADVIAWTARRKEIGALPEGFEPLDEVVRQRGPTPHGHVPLPAGAIKMLADPINAWIKRTGEAPLLSDILRP